MKMPKQLWVDVYEDNTGEYPRVEPTEIIDMYLGQTPLYLCELERAFFDLMAFTFAEIAS